MPFDAGQRGKLASVSLFVAVFPPPEVIGHLSKVVDQLGLEKHIPEDRWHITIAFLGDAEEAAAAKAMGEALLAPIGEVSVSGTGQFGEAVFWAGVAGDVDGLRKLNKHVRIAMRANRIEPDDRKYRPHLTLARPKHELPRSVIETMRSYHGPSWRPAELFLVRSELGPHPAYHRLGAWPLGS